MGLLSRLVFRNYTRTDFANDVRTAVSGPATNSGVRVNEESALRYITVYSCARVLAETLGSLPFFVFQDKANGSKDKARDHPLYAMLHDEPNEDMSSLSWREAVMGHIALSGNGYSILQHNRRGEVIDIYPWDWHMIQPVRNRETGALEYEVNDRGKPEILPAYRVLHIPGLGFDGIRGYSPVSMAREAIGLGLASTEFSARFYGQGMNVGTVLEHPKELGDKAYDRLQKSVEERWAGLANSWRPVILEEGMKFNRVPMPLRDAQFIEQQQLTDAQLCGLFRVPPHMVARLERSTNNNIEHQGIEFVVYTMLPWVTRWEQAINRRFFSRREREQGYYVKFNVAALLRGDYKSRQEGLAIMRQNGVINANQWLELEDMNPQEGGTGKVYLVNGNMISVETAAKQQPRQTVAGGSE